MDAFPEWALDKRNPIPADLLQGSFVNLLLYAECENARRPGLIETPERAARAWMELTGGYGGKLDLKTFDAEGYSGIVTIKDIPFHSLCEHHCLPFMGTVDFAYIPHLHILGLSKFARLTEHYSRRLQTQERLTAQMAAHLHQALRPLGVMVIVRAAHTCMSMRGVQKPGAITITSEVTGSFKENPETRAEAMGLLS